MKKLELNQMENLNGGDNSTCYGWGTGVAISATLIGFTFFGVATGGAGFAAAALVGSWVGTMAAGSCIISQ